MKEKRYYENRERRWKKKKLTKIEREKENKI